MRLNKFVALATGKGRRAVDILIDKGRVKINQQTGRLGQEIDSQTDRVSLDGTALHLPKYTTIILNKPVGYVSSRRGQGNKTIYDLMPKELHNLKPVGRLDKDSSGLLLLTNDGDLAQGLSHPSFRKEKVYEVVIDRVLTNKDKLKIEQGVMLDDGLSKLALEGSGINWIIKMSEGRNRQIRRTFARLGYKIITLNRTHFGTYRLTGIALGRYKQL